MEKSATFVVGDFVWFEIKPVEGKSKRRGNITKIQGENAEVDCSGQKIKVKLDKLKHYL